MSNKSSLPMTPANDRSRSEEKFLRHRETFLEIYMSLFMTSKKIFCAICRNHLREGRPRIHYLKTHILDIFSCLRSIKKRKKKSEKGTDSVKLKSM